MNGNLLGGFGLKWGCGACWVQVRHSPAFCRGCGPITEAVSAFSWLCTQGAPCQPRWSIIGLAVDAWFGDFVPYRGSWLYLSFLDPGSDTGAGAYLRFANWDWKVLKT